MTSDRESGAVLLSVLLLVVILSALSVEIMGDLRGTMRRTSNTLQRLQAEAYVAGAEDLARLALQKSWQQSPTRSSLNEPWATGPLQFPIDGGGLSVLVRDATNCFNLNSLVSGGEDGEPQDHPANRAAFLRLLMLVGLSDYEAEELADGTMDWIDADSRARSRGAEDATYQNGELPYGSANTLFHDLAELRLISGVTEDLFRQVRPYLCVRPVADAFVVDINTLSLEEVPLLAAALGPALSISEAEQILAGRPQQGFRSIDTFWADPVFEGKVIEEAERARIVLLSTTFEVSTRVRYHDAETEWVSLVEVKDGGRVHVLSRSMGVPL